MADKNVVQDVELPFDIPGLPNTIDFDQYFKESMADFIKEKFKPMMAAKIENMMDRVLDDVFSNWGEVAKAAKSTIEQELQVSLGGLQLNEFNALVAHNIQHEVNKGLSEAVTDKISDIVKSLIGAPGQEKISAYDFLDLFVKQKMEEDHDYSGRFSYHYEFDHENGWHELWLSEDPDKEKHYCDLRFLISDKRGYIFSIQLHDWKGEYNPGTISPRALNGFQSILMRLYNSGTHITDLESLADHCDDGNYYWERD